MSMSLKKRPKEAPVWKRILFFLLLFSFVFGGGAFFQKQNNIFVVKKLKIRADDFARLFSMTIHGKNLDKKRKINLAYKLLDHMLMTYMIEKELSNIGIDIRSLPKEDRKNLIVSRQELKSDSGKFDQNMFERIKSALGKTDQMYFQDISREYFTQLFMSCFMYCGLHSDFKDILKDGLLQRRIVDYYVIDPNKINIEAHQIKDQDVELFYKNNKHQFSAPPRREFKLVEITSDEADNIHKLLESDYSDLDTIISKFNINKPSLCSLEIENKKFDFNGNYEFAGANNLSGLAQKLIALELYTPSILEFNGKYFLVQIVSENLDRIDCEYGKVKEKVKEVYIANMKKAQAQKIIRDYVKSNDMSLLQEYIIEHSSASLVQVSDNGSDFMNTIATQAFKHTTGDIMNSFDYEDNIVLFSVNDIKPLYLDNKQTLDRVVNDDLLSNIIYNAIYETLRRRHGISSSEINYALVEKIAISQ